MIEALTIANVATYSATPQVLQPLSRFNYIYGANAAGKTTLSNLIANPSHACFANCSISWKDGNALQSLVYNRDFIARNFSPSAELKGIFTLGEQNISVLQGIAEARSARDEASAKAIRLTETLKGPDGNGGKEGELREARNQLKERSWQQKKRFDSVFQPAFSFYGVRADSEKFLDRVLAEDVSNAASLFSLEDLTEKAKSIFGDAPAQAPRITMPASEALLAHESNPILKKNIVGRTDVDIAAMIQKLGNSDWVKEGRPYFHANDGHCPFCQQTAPMTLEQSLIAYFDEAFVTDTKAIETLRSDYEREGRKIGLALERLTSEPSEFLDVEKLARSEELLSAQFQINLKRIDDKAREPSISISMESLEPILREISQTIDAANLRIDHHNKMVGDIGNQKTSLIAQVWKFIVASELAHDLADYRAKSAGLTKAIESLNQQIQDARAEASAKEAEIQALEKQTTSTQPTIDSINAVLKSFNFQSFSIKQAASNTYKLVRADGSDARETLSEGEKTFVTFLYFYHLLRGSNAESGITTDRVIVFDDPVSSLDSDVLFIVSSLIREVIAEARQDGSLIKQVFVLTHNVYFHKEVTYANNRGNGSLKEETFWTVRKRDARSELIIHSTNPIKTSYELLWHDVRKPTGTEMTIQNTLRRIIESYFKILGGIDKDWLLSKFDGSEKPLCAALLSWVNDGSHGVHDDVFVSHDQMAMDACLKTFHRIFYRSGHESHYQMMLGDDYVALSDEDGYISPTGEPERSNGDVAVA